MRDDTELIQQFRAATDEEAASQAFQEIMRKHYKTVFACAFKRLKDHEEAEEVASDTFLKAFHKLEEVENPAKLVGWLYTIATRLAIDRLREAGGQRLEIVGAIDEPPPEEGNRVPFADSGSIWAYSHAWEAAADWERVVGVKRLIGLLPEEDRWVMALRYYDEFNHLKYEKIAEITDKTVRSVKHRVARATKLIKAIATQLNDLLNLLPDEEALLMHQYLFDGASPTEIAGLLGISPDAVVAGLEGVMQRWKKLIAKQKRTEPGTRQGSQAGWDIFTDG